MNSFDPIAVIALTPQTCHSLLPLCQSLGLTLICPDTLKLNDPCVQTYSGSLKDHLQTIWSKYNGFIFSLASGAVIRLISPLLNDKASDPAVIVIDPCQKFVISLCSGHLGGADRLAHLISQQIEAITVITSGSQGINWQGIDCLGLPFGWRKGIGDWTGVSAAIVKGEKIQVIQEVGSTLWQDHLPPGLNITWGFNEENAKARVWISGTQRKFAPQSQLPKVQWHPRIFWLGIGCIRGVSLAQIEQAVQQVFQQQHLAIDAIAGIATLDLKSNEQGLVAYGEKFNLPLKTFTPEQLKTITVPNPSEIVEASVNTPSVAEAAALMASKGQLIVTKQVIENCVTVAVAQSEVEYTGREGKLSLVGMGPGALEQITPAAKTAIAAADVIIGYSLYLDLIKPLKQAGQIIESYPITQEKQRAQRAIQLAQWGLTVAVVSSGDCGIFGMAGLVMEELSLQGWDGESPQLEVLPGISAIQAAAARVGAPLMHDFCAISLSDLLTPWQVIEKRLQAAAEADFVTALYNPRSLKRQTQIVTAQRIFLAVRSPDTPVALVESAYRDHEQITVTTLEKMLDVEINMLTTVIIGNKTTYQQGNWLITPRGYNDISE
ncbi:MAG: precorrin-3B C(17)-methyltransferase [Microcystaceae cyanobacterium]